MPVEAKSTVHCPSDLFSLLGVAGLVRKTGGTTCCSAGVLSYPAGVRRWLRLSSGYKALLQNHCVTLLVRSRLWTCIIGIVNNERMRVRVCASSQLYASSPSIGGEVLRLGAHVMLIGHSLNPHLFGSSNDETVNHKQSWTAIKPFMVAELSSELGSCL